MSLFGVSGFGVLLLLTAIAAPGVGWAASFTGLGGLPGGPAPGVGLGPLLSQASGISADGSVVVGVAGLNDGSTGGTIQAVRWTSGGVADPLFPNAPFGAFSRASGVSADGSFIVGVDPNSGGFRLSASGFTSLGGLPGSSALNPEGVSSDGSVVAGFVDFLGGRQAVRWTPTGNTVGLGFLPGGTSSEARGISADGSIVVGSAQDASLSFPIDVPVKWPAGGGVVELPLIPGPGFGPIGSSAQAASADGSVIVGDSNARAVLWPAAGGTVDLGSLPGGNGSSLAMGVSADGSVVVGEASSAAALPFEAFIWDSTDGMRSLRTVLVNDFGLDLTGWTLTAATGVSADGLSIVGFGSNPSGFGEAFLAQIPEPTTVLLLGIGLAGLAVMRRRRTRT